MDAVSVEHVSKRFRLPMEHAATLQQRFIHPIATSRYRTLAALDDVCFAVPRGQFLGITGPNGCGKSTLLKILSRIYDADSGRVVVNGRLSPFLELGVGFKQELTARENVLLGGAVLGLTRPAVAERLHAVLEFAELVEFADQKLRNFSSGMALRLAFAVAMLAKADILLMDEVLAVGDAHFQEKCFDAFAQYKREGRTVILVSHDLAALESYCDRVILMDGGRVRLDGNPAEVTAEYRHLVAGMSGPADTPTSVKRWGTREVEILSARLVAPNGKSSSSFLTSDPFRITIEYRVNRNIGGFVLGIGIKRSDGHVIAGPNTRGSDIDPLTGTAGTRGRVSFTLDHMPLLSASYLVAVSLMDEHLSRMYDFAEDILSFRITDYKGRIGIVALDGIWSHERAH